MNSPPDTSGNSSFSAQVPGLQLAVDSTSLGEFKVCPRKYYYTIVLGWQPRETSVHLTWGLLLHGGRERYDHARSRGEDHETSLELVLRWALLATWNKELKRGWISDIPAKSRLTLIRTLVWYLDALGESDPIRTVILDNGKPACELSFRFDSGFVTHSGEHWMLCGHLDRIGELAGEEYMVDIKSTMHSLDASFFSKYSPDNQFSTYTLAGRVAFERPIRGLIVDGVQVGVNFARFERGIVTRSDSEVDEWLAATGAWLGQMQTCAETAHWPMNDKNCFQFGRDCDFRSVCKRPPAAREAWLAANFRKRVWDPLVVRGDI